MHRVDANGARIPAIGLGTWTLRGAECTRMVEAALDVGYRHVDTAIMYENEDAVGEGLRASPVPRDEIFLTTKVWYTDIAAGKLQRAAEASIRRLRVDYLDLLLIHWPNPKVPLADSIGALNEVRNAGLARNIGVSNFTLPLIAEATALSEAPLACNQVEYHPYLDQTKVHAACRAAGMAMVSYCPIYRGGPLFLEPAVLDAARAHGRTPAQIVLRWQVQQDGVVAIPRTTRTERLAENLAVFDFALSDGEMAAISKLRSANERICDYDFSPKWDAA
jgi:diketogulonate reductase-like aldo/keto reductase